MAEYKSKNSGLLMVDNVKEGDKIILLEPAYEQFSEAKQKSYWNCKVELPDGSQKLAGLMDSVCDKFADKWGSNTDEWAGRTALVNIKTSKAGNPYIMLVPTDEPKINLSTKTVISENPKVAGTNIEYPKNDVNPEDIPF
jgi:hypothetical protein